MNNQRYQVGQVLFILDEERHRIIPIQIVSQTTRRTMSGLELSYEIVTPGKPDRPVMLDKVRGDMFTSLETLQKILLENANQAITKMIARAGSVAQKAFSEMVQQEDVVLDPIAEELDHIPAIVPINSQLLDGLTNVTLPDGSVTQIAIPPSEPLLEKVGVQKEVG